jgi:hypothetical protein
VDLTINRDSQAYAIGVRDNGMVYVGGYYMNNHHYIIPCFWKDGNNRTNLPLPSGGDGEVYDIAIDETGMRYYAGVALHTSSFAGYTPKACYWRHTTRTDLQLGGSTFDIYGAGAYGITINGSDIYTAGYTDWFGQTDEPSGGSYPVCVPCRINITTINGNAISSRTVNIKSRPSKLKIGPCGMSPVTCFWCVSSKT